MKKLSLLLVVFLLCQLLLAPLLLAAPSSEGRPLNFWQEADIIFWQTIPFTLMWGYFIATQASGGGGLNLYPVLSASLVISSVNAYLYASRVVTTSESPALLTE